MECEEAESPLSSPIRERERAGGGGCDGSANGDEGSVSSRGDKHGGGTADHPISNPGSSHGLFGVPVTVSDSKDDRDDPDLALVEGAEDDNYCLRALQCACELREHKDSNLGTHIAVTAGDLFTHPQYT